MKFKKQIPESIITDELDDFEEKSEYKDIFYRSPRFKNDVEKREFKIDSPPNSNNREEIPLMYMLGPAITMGMTSVLTGAITVQNVIGQGKSYAMGEEITKLKLSHTIAPYLLLSRRHMLEKIIKKMREEGEYE